MGQVPHARNGVQDGVHFLHHHVQGPRAVHPLQIQDETPRSESLLSNHGSHRSEDRWRHEDQFDLGGRLETGGTPVVSPSRRFKICAEDAAGRAREGVRRRPRDRVTVQELACE